MKCAQPPTRPKCAIVPVSVVLRDLLGHLAGMGEMVSVVPLVPPEHLELMEEVVKWAHLGLMEETVTWALLAGMEEMVHQAAMVYLVLVEQVEETVLWALQVLQQGWTWKGFETL